MKAPLLYLALISTGFAAHSHADIFDEMEQASGSLQQERSTPAGQPSATNADEFARWRTQHLAEYESFKQRYFAALKRYQEQIQEHWEDPQVTDRTHWVDYSEDFSTRRVVDFEANQIQLSFQQRYESDQAAQAAIAKQIETILQQTVASAQRQDPVLRAVEVKPDQRSDAAKPLVQGVSASQDPAEIRALAQQLARQAQIARPTPAARPAAAAQPARPQTPASSAAARPERTATPSAPALVVTIPLPKQALTERAQSFRAQVIEQAGKQQLDPSLVYAVIHTESAFNPLARSHIPAYGLMQIVPESAGRDVARTLYGQERVFSADYLFNPDNNIQAGTVYLNLLYYRYLKGIDDPLSRLYCTIAAYNTGAGNVAKTFVGSTRLRDALPLINRMTPEQIYQTLVEKLPYEETRHYLQKVVTRQQLYRDV